MLTDTTLSNTHYDFIMAGGGCAALSLVYHMHRAGLSRKRMLIIDKSPKNSNDRTWCFWERGENVFEEIVYRKWQRLWIYGHKQWKKQLNIEPYTYKMIRGIDFYTYVYQALKALPNITFLQANISHFDDTETHAKVTTDKGTYTANWLFNSYKRPQKVANRGYNYLLQHFLGWEIELDKPIFTPQQATLMDFRIEQGQDTQFVYVLPYSTTEALVEFTVFSPEVFSKQVYKTALIKYLQQYLGLAQHNYQITHTEFGVIPMYDSVFKQRHSKHIMNIGTAGGQTRPSTGYTFVNIQRQSNAIVQALLQTAQPFYQQNRWQKRFNLYDSTLLQVLNKGYSNGANVFERLFKYNKASTILAFLDGNTTVAQELGIFTTVPIVPFVKAMGKVSYRNL